MKLGQYVWWEGEGWLFIGMEEDGTYMLTRPIHRHPFKIVEFDYVYAEDFDEFFTENGEG